MTETIYGVFVLGVFEMEKKNGATRWRISTIRDRTYCGFRHFIKSEASSQCAYLQTVESQSLICVSKGGLMMKKKNKIKSQSKAKCFLNGSVALYLLTWISIRESS